ncbi:MAG: lipoate--protein ligase family protein [Victivallaceae bacterium]|nr:lipoate--protein ligase family protein [Victivallaceae bacterium]
MTQEWLLWLDEAHSPWLNMAIDELLLKYSAENNIPVLRIYAWNCPTVSFGYVQHYPSKPQDYSIVRRMTGGGIVDHGNDLTYTVVIPPAHQICAMNRIESYHILHQAVKRALEYFGITVTLATDDSPPVDRATMQCFITPTRYDVIGDGEKYAGSAQRRTRNGILHQGSISQSAANNDNNLLREQLVSGFETELDIKFSQYKATSAFLAEAQSLADNKYSSEAWNKFKESPDDR